MLLSSLTEEAMVEVLGLTTARDVWLALETSFSHCSKTCELHLKDELQLIKRGTHIVSEYSHYFKALCDQLSAMGHPIADMDKSHWFLRGLGGDFSIFSIAQMSLTPLPAFTNLVSKAESFAIFQKSLEQSPIAPAEFNDTHGSSSNSGGCGHSKQSSGRGGNQQKSGPGRGQRQYSPRCQICKTEVHTTDSC